MTERVEQALAEAVNRRELRFDWVSQRIGVGRNRLRAGLRAEGRTFPELLEAEKKARVAKVLVSNPDARGRVLMNIAGYATTSAFYFAFNRWFGMGLREYRELIKGGKLT